MVKSEQRVELREVGGKEKLLLGRRKHKSQSSASSSCISQSGWGELKVDAI